MVDRKFVVLGSYRTQRAQALAHIIKVQSCAVDVHQNLVRDWFGLRGISCKFNLGRVVELADYEGTHSEGGRVRRWVFFLSRSSGNHLLVLKR